MNEKKKIAITNYFFLYHNALDIKQADDSLDEKKVETFKPIVPFTNCMLE